MHFFGYRLYPAVTFMVGLTAAGGVTGVAAALGGCSVNVPDPSAGPFACASDGDCARDYVCGLDRTCVAAATQGSDCRKTPCDAAAVCVKTSSGVASCAPGCSTCGTSSVCIVVPGFGRDGNPTSQSVCKSCAGANCACTSGAVALYDTSEVHCVSVGGPCQADSDCSGAVCAKKSDGSGSCQMGCNNTAPCNGTGQACVMVLGMSSQPSVCRACDSDCGQTKGAVCVGSGTLVKPYDDATTRPSCQCQDSECRTDLNSSSARCDAGACVLPCNGDGDCSSALGTGYVCRNYTCDAPCTSDAECGNGRLCVRSKSGGSSCQTSCVGGTCASGQACARVVGVTAGSSRDICLACAGGCTEAGMQCRTPSSSTLYFDDAPAQPSCQCDATACIAAFGSGAVCSGAMCRASCSYDGDCGGNACVNLDWSGPGTCRTGCSVPADCDASLALSTCAAVASPSSGVRNVCVQCPTSCGYPLVCSATGSGPLSAVTPGCSCDETRCSSTANYHCNAGSCIYVPPPSTSITPFSVVGSLATFNFTCTSSVGGCTFECSADGGTWTPCTSPMQYRWLRGTHQLSVRATDANGVEPSPPSRWVTPANLTFALVGAGAHHTCAVVNEDSSLWCFGDNAFRQILGVSNVPARYAQPTYVPNDAMALVGVRQLTGGLMHTCAIDYKGGALGGRLWCWGSNGAGQLGESSGIMSEPVPAQIGANEDWLEIAAGREHTCGIRNGGSLWCFGRNLFGELGVGDALTRFGPTQVSGSWSHVAAGDYSTCAIDTSGLRYCFGRNDAGELGLGDFSLQLWPTHRAGETVTTWTSIAMGSRHACGLATGTPTTTTDLYCWGRSDWGQTAQAAKADLVVPTLISNGDWALLAAGDDHTCVTNSSANPNYLSCFGHNDTGELGTYDTSLRRGPSPAVATTPWNGVYLGLTVGDDHTCALLQGGELRCFGSREFGQLGDFAGRALVPRNAVQAGGDSWLSVSAGNEFTCGITADLKGWCFGRDSEGELGNGYGTVPPYADSDFAPASTRRSLGTGSSGWTAVASGNQHGCGIFGVSAATLWCWGDNNAAQLGLDSAGGYFPEVVQTMGGQNWTGGSVTVGARHSCAIDKLGALYCWGDNLSDQLGLGAGAMKPTQLTTAYGAWSMASAGEIHTCGLTTAGNVYCWGNNAAGQLGVNDYVFRTTPTLIAGGRTYAKVSAGARHTCALTAVPGDLYCWGSDYDGQLGLGGTGGRVYPQQVTGTWRDVSAGGYTTCAIDNASPAASAGRLWCFGSNSTGLLGIGQDGTVSSTPQQVGADTDYWLSVSVGATHTCARAQSGTLMCWGSNLHGQLGDSFGFSTSAVLP